MKKRHTSVIVAVIFIIIGFVLLFGGIGLGIATDGFNFHDEESFTKEFNNEKITNLDIEFKYGTMQIKTGEAFKVEADNIDKDSINCEVRNNTLVVENKRDVFHFGFGWYGNTNLTVYIPRDVKFEDVKVKTGAGKFELSDINADNINIDCGIGEGIYNKLSAKYAKFKSGIGSQRLYDCTFTEFDLNAGIGEVSYNGKIAGKCNIKGGIGEVRMNLSGNTSDYKFDVRNGLGDVRINGRSANDFKNINGENDFSISNGIGAVNIYIGG